MLSMVNGRARALGAREAMSAREFVELVLAAHGG
jgi:hypothetical protein